MWTKGVQRIALWGMPFLVAAENAFPRLGEVARQSAEDVRMHAEAPRRQNAAVDDSAPGLISLHLRDAGAQSACNKIARQAKVTITPWPATLWTHEPEASLDVGDCGHPTCWDDRCPDFSRFPEALGPTAANPSGLYPIGRTIHAIVREIRS